jgi:hypothetical protein
MPQCGIVGGITFLTFPLRGFDAYTAANFVVGRA